VRFLGGMGTCPNPSNAWCRKNVTWHPGNPHYHTYGRMSTATAGCYWFTVPKAFTVPGDGWQNVIEENYQLLENYGCRLDSLETSCRSSA
jgi:hypothetical protein